MMSNKFSSIRAAALRIGITLFIWQCVAYLHLMTGYFDAVSYRPDHTLGLNDYVYYALAYGSWAIFSLLLFECLKRVKQGFLVSGYTLIFITCLAIWLPTYFSIDYAINAWINEAPEKGILEQVLGTPNALLFFYGMVYALTFVACTSIIMYKNARNSHLNALKLQTQQVETQLQLLQSQLGPHFLFNCLGAISALARTENKHQLLSSISRVGNLLRYTIESAKHKEVFLQDELSFVDDYIALQKLRFGDRFEYRSKVESSLGTVKVPPFFVQPLVENAFVHAVGNTERTVDIVLTISNERGGLSVGISNTYIDAQKTQASLGSAIHNLGSRLEALYPKSFSLYHRREGDHYLCDIFIPIGK